LFFSVGTVMALLGALQLVCLGILGELAVGLSDLSHTRLIGATCRESSVGGNSAATGVAEPATGGHEAMAEVRGAVAKVAPKVAGAQEGAA
jgi:hypothetical protein